MAAEWMSMRALHLYSLILRSRCYSANMGTVVQAVVRHVSRRHLNRCKEVMNLYDTFIRILTLLLHYSRSLLAIPLPFLIIYLRTCYSP
jgi:hypothetical protein